jgi:hypothetical protein
VDDDAAQSADAAAAAVVAAVAAAVAMSGGAAFSDCSAVVEGTVSVAVSRNSPDRNSPVRIRYCARQVRRAPIVMRAGPDLNRI